MYELLAPPGSLYCDNCTSDHAITEFYHVTTYRVFDWPVRELLGVTEMSEVVDVAKELVLQLRVPNHRNGAVLVVGRHRRKRRGEICPILTTGIAIMLVWILDSQSVFRAKDCIRACYSIHKRTLVTVFQCTKPHVNAKFQS